MDKPVLTPATIESQAVLELPERDMLSSLIKITGNKVGVAVCANVIGDNPQFTNCGANLQG